MVQPGERAKAPQEAAGSGKAANGQRAQKAASTKRMQLLSKADVDAAMKLTTNKQIVLPLEHKLWSKEELELFIMSDGAVRPRYCSLPDEASLLDTQMTDQQLEAALDQAAEWLRDADAVLVGSGAGMGVDAGLATFRGGQGGVWPAFEDLGLSYEDVCDPKWFAEDPRLAWGFWLFCHQAYQQSQPHGGYDIVRKWAKQRCACGAFSFTSNIDGHWQRSGWPKEHVLECHGALSWLQCSTPCCDDIWEMPLDLHLREDPKSHRALGELPKCPHCGAVARPCVLMFGGDNGFSRKGRQCQEGHYEDWYLKMKENCMYSPDPKLVCLELGCGVTVPTVRSELGRTLEDLPWARLVRVNPENPGFPKQLKGRAVSLPLGAMEALTRLDARLDVEERATFIIHDHFGGGVEIEQPRYFPWHRLFRRAWTEIGWVMDEDCCDLEAVANNIYQRDVRHRLDWEQAVPEELLLHVDGLRDPPAVCVLCSGGHFLGTSPALSTRFSKVYSLLVDLIGAFQSEAYQKQLAEVEDRLELRDMIRAVHLEVLPRHGYEVSESLKPGQWMAIQQRMQAFIQSGDWWPDLRKVADCSQEVSGGWKIHTLPLPQRRRAA